MVVAYVGRVQRGRLKRRVGKKRWQHLAVKPVGWQEVRRGNEELWW